MIAVHIVLALLPIAATPADRERELLAGADERIVKHRTGEAVVRLIGTDGKALPAGQAAQIEQTQHAFLFGSNIFMLHRCGSPEENEAYAKRFADLLNYATLPFYWWGFEGQPDAPDYARIDAIAKWCKEHHVTMKGHPLVWNFVDPVWIPKDLDLAGSLQIARIFREVAHYKGSIDMWDVVNEATAYDRPECRQKSPVLTGVIRQQGVGPFVRRAFAAARAANPQGTLVINDYRSGEDFSAKVLSELVDAEGKALYDIIGIQCHQHGGAWSARHIWDICERFAPFGKPLHFTEATILSGEQGWELRAARKAEKFDWPSTPEGEKRQAEQVTRFYTMLFSHPAVEAITWWDFADRGSWQGAPAGFLRQDLTPKPAYDALKALIKGKWWTRKDLTAGENGAAKFSGFFGDYAVYCEAEGRKLAGTFHFDKKTAGPIEVRLK